ncbi:unnamed protein product, partial [Porites lobata]
MDECPYNLCNRWYFKSTGNEYSGPMTTEAVYFENIPQGAVKVELWVGQCSGETLGDAVT